MSLADRYSNWTSTHFGTNAANAALAGANTDPDQDGRDNYSEFISATDPLNASSVFRIDSVQRDSATQAVQVSVQGRAGRQYFLEAAVQPVGVAWSVVATSGMLVAAQTLVLQDGFAGTSQRFYRVAVSP